MILGVNIDHVATLRQARLGHEPDPVMGATLAILGGADGITLHVREDRRHVNDRDLAMLRDVVKMELNLEMAATPEMVSIATTTRPDLVTLVPEKREELTTEGGLNLQAGKDTLKKAIGTIKNSGIPVSLFINPDIKDVEYSRELGADMVEIHTGMYANASGSEAEKQLALVRDAIKRAIDLGLYANAGHGLSYANVRPVAQINGLRGLYIGHSIISRAVLVGLERAVRDIRALIESVI